MEFDAKHDGLQRTPWFRFSRHMPERDGYYEIRSKPGFPDTRCEWRNDAWWASARIAHRLDVFEWRGLTPTAYKYAVARLKTAAIEKAKMHHSK
jgi:hypothetical protein